MPDNALFSIEQDVMTSPNSISAEARSLLRYRLGRVLGEGADLQVFSAEDVESGAAVVVKRPHPTLISRNLHDDVERRMSAQAGLRVRGEPLPGLPRLYFVTEQDRFDWFFGDDPGGPYVVLVEERAKGVPLMGSITDQVRGRPVSLPLNLFVFHPSRWMDARGMKSPAVQVLEVIGHCLDYGYLARDLGPRNVLYAPANGVATVIDIGDLRKPRPETPRWQPVDIHDVLLEFFASYTTPEPRPKSAAEYLAIRDVRLSGRLERRALALSDEYENISNIAQREAALEILNLIGRRQYGLISEFRVQFEHYTTASAVGNDADGDSEDAWTTALSELRDPYWHTYLFDFTVDLKPYT